MDLTKAMTISARGMDAQSARLKVIAQNLANQNTTADAPGGSPYRRKTVTFESKMDQAVGAETVRIKQISPDMSDFPTRYDPSHPAANAQGYVQTPNVNSFVEVMDMKEAQSSYSANLNVMQVSRSMLTRTIDMLK
jgi:flagellar basal-body rod protein FlgC